MASIGQVLATPDAGWSRYEEDSPQFQYIGTWSRNASTDMVSGNAGDKVKFSFTGTGLRVLVNSLSNRSAMSIQIDGSLPVVFQGYHGAAASKVLAYEVTGLADSVHTVEIEHVGASGYATIDAVDITDAGRLLHPLEVMGIDSLASVGERVRVRYTASPNNVGSFSHFGQATGEFIPTASTATPSGDFYFIYVGNDNFGRRVLVADRNVQHSISWDALNAAGVATGSGVPIQVDGAEEAVLRLLTGGISATDKENEWDDYVVRSTLGGGANAGDNLTWHWVGLSSWTSTTSASGAGARTARGNSAAAASTSFTTSTASSLVGFRPVLVVNIPAAGFDGALTSTVVQRDNPMLVGTILHTKPVQYGILVNGVQKYPSNGLTPLAPPPINVSYTVQNDDLVIGNNIVTIRMRDLAGVESVRSFAVMKLNTVPSLDVNVKGLTLSISVGDPDQDRVQFLVRLNGNQVYPTNGQFTELAEPVVTYSKTFSSSEVLIGQSNVVEVTARDEFGAETSATVSFMGDYAGLMFQDEQGNYYSTDAGEVLRLLDFGALVAGQVSFHAPVILVNKNGFKVSNLVLTYDGGDLPTGAYLQLSKTDSPFVSEESLNYSDVLDYGQSVVFFVRLVTDTSANPGIGWFDIRASADPVQ